MRTPRNFLKTTWCGSWLAALAGASAMLLAGCGPDRPEMVPVRGKVTFAGSPPPAPGAIYFAPLETAKGLPRRPGRADFDAQGSYAVTSFSDGDGLVPGIYRVRLECWKTAPEMGKPGESYVPADFSPTDLTVPADARSIKHNVEVPAAAGAD